MAENKVLFPLLIGVLSPQLSLDPTWRIIPVRKYLVTPVYKPFSSPFGRGIIPFWEDLRTMVIFATCILAGMILQVCPLESRISPFFLHIYSYPVFFWILRAHLAPFDIDLFFSHLALLPKEFLSHQITQSHWTHCHTSKKIADVGRWQKNGRVLTWEDRMIRHVFGVICSSSCYIWFTS